LAHLEDRNQATAGSIRVQHGHNPHVPLIDDRERLGDGRVRGHTDDLGLHDIADLRGHIGDETRGGSLKCAQDEIDALIGVAAPCRDRLGHPGAPFEFRIANRRTDRVGVGISMANHQDFVHLPPR
jgi:hypothetical protein